MTTAEPEIPWQEHPRDALALIRASITGDLEGARVLAKYADSEEVIKWLVQFSHCWLLEHCGYHRDADFSEVYAAALTYLDKLATLDFLSSQSEDS